MNKLANAPEVSDDDAAKYLHVNKRTLSVYHRSNAEARMRAAEVLSRSSPVCARNGRTSRPDIVASGPKSHPRPGGRETRSAASDGRSVGVVSGWASEHVFSVVKQEVIDVDWDWDGCPMTQLSENDDYRATLLAKQAAHKARVWEAPASPANAKVSQVLQNIPYPFPF